MTYVRRFTSGVRVGGEKGGIVYIEEGGRDSARALKKWLKIKGKEEYRGFYTGTLF